MLISIIIRTLNEEKYLEELLSNIFNQKLSNFKIEVVLIDSGSNDNTIKIAESYDVRITNINKRDFSFGRSLNQGCIFSKGEILVFISGHCVPVNNFWLSELIKPLIEEKADYVYGRQQGRDTTKFSENQLFNQLFPPNKKTFNGEFCNNANAAITRQSWSKFKFDEDLTGLEDLDMGLKITKNGGIVFYTPEASVFHIHDENWSQIFKRYERESIALKKIYPNFSFSITNLISSTIKYIFKDLKASLKDRIFIKELRNIIFYRFVQFFAIYRGQYNVTSTEEKKEKFFYNKIN